MLQKNYSAWRINPNDFSDKWSASEKLHFFSRFAILAPSGHNSQPWELKLGDNSLEVSVNKLRFLSSDGSGLLSAEPYISVGTFLEVFNLAARGFGYEVDIKILPGEEKIANITIVGEAERDASLLRAITERTSNRNPYKKTAVSRAQIQKITSTELKGIISNTITKRKDIELVSNLTEDAIKAIMSNPLYRKELGNWVRTNYTRSYYGMPGFTHGFDNIKSLLSKFVIKYGNKYGPEASKSKKLIEQSGALIIVSCTKQNKASFINAGRLFSQICVLAYDTNLAASALGASVLYADTRSKLVKHFDMKGRPMYILRLGKPTAKAPHSPRFPIEKILSPATH